MVQEREGRLKPAYQKKKPKKQSFRTEAEQVRDGVRINQFLSSTGLCSRREADARIRAGAVTIQDGANGISRTAQLGDRVYQGQTVLVNGKPVVQEETLVILAFHKPRGIVCTTDRREPQNVIDFLQYDTRIFPIGRLDKESEGLLLLTNDGAIVNKILRAGNAHEKEYEVRVNKPLTRTFLADMAKGVPILDTVTKPCRIEPLSKDSFRIILVQGLNRQIRRMCEHFGYRVLSLKRTRVMQVRLGRLKVGTYRRLTDGELATLREQLAHSSNLPAGQTEDSGE